MTSPDAAGIAEGTIFRVFAGKDALIEAVIDHALDVGSIERGIGVIDAELPLEETVTEVVALLQRRVVDIWRLMSSVGTRFHEHARRPAMDSEALVSLFDGHRARSDRRAGRGGPDPAVLHAGDDPSDDGLRTARGGRGGSAVPVRRGWSPAMLIRLLRTHLRPYRRLLLVVVFMQTVQTVATLALPTLNARIIDNGILKHDQGYIRSTGAVMLGFALVQVCFAIGAVYFGAKVAMGFGRDVRGSLFHTVTDFSAREVGHVRRAVAHHPDHQRRAAGAAAGGDGLHDGDRRPASPSWSASSPRCSQDVGLSVVLVVQHPDHRDRARRAGRSRMVPAFRLMQVRIDQINRVLREQITGIRVVRAFVREPEETSRFAADNAELTEVSLRAGRLMSVDVPDGQPGHQPVERRRALARRLPHRVRPDADRIAGGLPELPDPDPDVGGDGHLHDLHDPPGVGVGRPHPGGARHASRRCAAPPSPIRIAADAGASRVPRRRLPLSGRRPPGADRHLLRHPRRADDGDRRQHRRGQDHPAATDPPALRRHRRHGAASTGSTCARSTPAAVERHRPGAATPVPLLRDGGLQPAPTASPTPPRSEMWEALEVAQAADFVRRHAGRRWTRASTRAAPTCRAVSASGWPSPGPWSAGRTIYLFDDSFSALDLATDARLRAALKPVHRQQRRADRRPAGLDHHLRRPHPGPRGRRGGRPRAPTPSCASPARPTPRSCSRSSAQRRSA